MFISGFNSIAVSFCCPLDATMVVKEAKILQNFSEMPVHVMKDLILVLIALESKYLTEYFPFENKVDNKRFREDLVLLSQKVSLEFRLYLYLFQ